MSRPHVHPEIINLLIVVIVSVLSIFLLAPMTRGNPTFAIWPGVFLIVSYCAIRIKYNEPIKEIKRFRDYYIKNMMWVIGVVLITHFVTQLFVDFKIVNVCKSGLFYSKIECVGETAKEKWSADHQYEIDNAISTDPDDAYPQ